MRQKLKFAVRLLVSIFMIGILIYIEGHAQIYKELITSRLDYILAVYILILTVNFVTVYR